MTSSVIFAFTVRGACARGNHSFWGFDSERSSAVLRHREVDFRLARKICADLGIPPPSGPR